jgi:fatty-acid desaturase
LLDGCCCEIISIILDMASYNGYFMGGYIIFLLSYGIINTTFDIIIQSLFFGGCRLLFSLFIIHRGFSHSSFVVTKPIYNWIFTFLATLSHQGSPRQWAIVHQHHHAYCDTIKDPHSPIIMGYFNAFFGGIINPAYSLEPLYNRELLDSSPLIVHDYIFPLVLICEHAFWYYIGGIRYSTISIISALISLLAALSFNTAFHTDQQNSITCKANNAFYTFSILYGEHNHHDHHIHPSKARRCKYDLIYYAIMIPLKKLHIIKFQEE